MKLFPKGRLDHFRPEGPLSLPFKSSIRYRRTCFCPPSPPRIIWFKANCVSTFIHFFFRHRYHPIHFIVLFPSFIPSASSLRFFLGGGSGQNVIRGRGGVGGKERKGREGKGFFFSKFQIVPVLLRWTRAGTGRFFHLAHSRCFLGITARERGGGRVHVGLHIPFLRTIEFFLIIPLSKIFF